MPGSTVLVVDDDPVITRLLQVTFEMDGYRVLTATDAEEAVERALADRPDLIVSDVMMPGVDGLELAKRLRRDPATASTPIVLLSAKAQAADLAAGRAVADDYLTKPFEPMELLERVALLLAGAS